MGASVYGWIVGMSNIIDESFDDKADKSVDEIWADEAEKRLAAYQAGKLEGIPIEEVFKEV